jgi:copper(I)-binding protein
MRRLGRKVLPRSGDDVTMKKRLISQAITVALLASQAGALFACDLKVESAWIREAPPNAMALAGYARLSNNGTSVLKIQSFASVAFGSVEAHESLTENGVAKMRPTAVEIPAKGSLQFAAGGKHFMLMAPKQSLKQGDVVTIDMTDATGCVTSVPFKVSSAQQLESASKDHSKMDHSKMDHSGMKHD